MKYLLNVLVLVSSIFICFTINPNPANACSCIEPLSVEDELARSEAVFSGKAVKVTDKEAGFRKSGLKRIIFEVHETWKGASDSQILITTGSGGGDCGIEFREGEDYLVYARQSDMYGGSGDLVTIMCDRTAKLTEAVEDMELLGEGSPPENVVDLQEKNIRTLLLWGVCGAAAVAGLVVVERKMKKH
ncbi:hypothetical protein D3H55_09035 [Bacillus salacetis]|uniref:Cobalamin biosynthesis protein CbiN n=1 Tax=Bacillus salacetis TaxID=2315464 RepID=A0A3A1QZC3_9BACI|nr:hypothetical protein [Bacillus salacetis]RIW34649.1 hypothetical protein D3H55_09035 [Bacillus salacetis]